MITTATIFDIKNNTQRPLDIIPKDRQIMTNQVIHHEKYGRYLITNIFVVNTHTGLHTTISVLPI